MKRFLLVLMSLLLCLSVCACDKKSKKKDSGGDGGGSSLGVHATAESVTNAMYKAFSEGDEATVFKTISAYNLDLVDEYLQGEEAAQFKKRINKQRENLKRDMEEVKEMLASGGKYEYEVLSVDECPAEDYDELFDGNFEFKNTAIADAVTNISKVKVHLDIAEIIDGKEDSESRTVTLYCFCIDGKWYVGEDF